MKLKDFLAEATAIEGSDEELSEFAPLAGMAARAAGSALAGKALDSVMGEEEEEVEEIVGPSDGYDPMHEIYTKMLESYMQEMDEDDGFMDKVVNFSVKSAPLSKLMNKEASDEDLEEETYPAQVEYPQNAPNFPRWKNQLRGEGMDARDESSLNRGFSGPQKEELEEETYPAQTEYPQNKPNFPRVVYVKRGGVNEAFMVMPLKENPMASAGANQQVIKKLWPQLIQIIAALPPELLAKVPEIASNTLQSKRSVGAGTVGENAVPLVEGFSSWLAQQGVDPELFRKMGGREKDDLVRQFIDFKKSRPSAQAPTPPEQVQGELGRMQRTGLPTMQSQPTQPSLPGRQLNLQRTGLPTMKKQHESKFVITKSQLKEALKESILIHNKKKVLDKIVQKEISNQIKIYQLCESLLKEGPVDSMWSSVRDAGQDFGTEQPQGTGEMATQNRFNDRAKQAQQVVAKALKNAEQAKSKFTQDVLKSANLVSQYHDSVAALVNTFDKVRGMLSGPEVQQLNGQIDQVVSQLQYDLNSEKEGIETFLNSLQNITPSDDGAEAETSRFPTAAELRDEANSDTEVKDADKSKKSKSKSKSK